MIFQGAPGAGKTVLMLECMEAVRCHSTADRPWVAISIRPATLKSAVQTGGMIVQAVNAESERLSKMLSGKITGKLEKCLQLVSCHT